MKILILILASCISLPAYSQLHSEDFSSIDYRVQFIEATTSAALAQLLTASYTNDLEKTRAIFRWITEHISYRVKESRNKKTSSVISSSTSDNDTVALKPLNERVADIVLQKKSGLCDGYARLFKTLCDYANIPCEIITGYARNDMDQPGKRFGSNHSWNAVLIDGKWCLLDVTWASGFVSKNNSEFIRSFNEQYFLTPPDEFIKDHYPDDLKWTLLTSPAVPTEFKRSPYKQKTFIKYKIASYHPSSGIIEASIGDTLELELQTGDFEYDQQVVPDLLLDSSVFFVSATRVFLNSVASPESSPQRTRIRYTYIVNSPLIEWLFIIYNDDVILRYKLNIRKQE